MTEHRAAGRASDGHLFLPGNGGGCAVGQWETGEGGVIVNTKLLLYVTLLNTVNRSNISNKINTTPIQTNR